MVIGGACDSYEFINSIESSGAWVVADGLCFGLRHYDGLIDTDSKDPVKAIADRYFDRAACPAVMDAFDHTHRILLNSIKNIGVQGVIGARLKYCDHWAAASKMMRDTLKENNKIPFLELEREYGITGSGQISTRLQAFFEMLAD
jgi:benzoyl-CoA reductase/2-hydroxyglutaryl-CoA dehydratase subunit BcrC/BadD/HgdB